MNRLLLLVALCLPLACASRPPRAPHAKPPTCVIANRVYLCDEPHSPSIRTRTRAEVKGWVCVPSTALQELLAAPPSD